MKLLCINDVIMTDGTTAFKAGEEYEFIMKSDGDIQRFSNNTVHIFIADGPQAWSSYFEYVLEDV
jgi:hypothetical protein